MHANVVKYTLTSHLKENIKVNPAANFRKMFNINIWRGSNLRFCASKTLNLFLIIYINVLLEQLLHF